VVPLAVMKAKLSFLNFLFVSIIIFSVNVACSKPKPNIDMIQIDDRLVSLKIGENQKVQGEVFAAENSKSVVAVKGGNIIEGNLITRHGMEQVIRIAKSEPGYIAVEQFGNKVNWDGAGLPYEGVRLVGIGISIGKGWNSWKNNFPYEIRSKGEDVLIVDGDGVVTGPILAKTKVDLKRVNNPEDNIIAVSATFCKDRVAILFRNQSNRSCHVEITGREKIKLPEEAVKLYTVKDEILCIGAAGQIVMKIDSRK
jgi:hypothetical protein